VEGRLLVEFGLVLVGMEAKGGFVSIHFDVSGDRVVGMALVEVFIEGVGGVFTPTLIRLGFDLSDAGVDGVELRGKGLHRPENGGKGWVDRGRRFQGEGPFPVFSCWGRSSGEGRAAWDYVCGGRGRGGSRSNRLAVGQHGSGLRVAVVTGQGGSSEVKNVTFLPLFG